MLLGRRLETLLARPLRRNTCRYYDTTAGKTPQPISTTANAANLTVTPATERHPLTSKITQLRNATDKPATTTKTPTAEKTIAGKNPLASKGRNTDLSSLTILPANPLQEKTCGLTFELTCPRRRAA